MRASLELLVVLVFVALLGLLTWDGREMRKEIKTQSEKIEKQNKAVAKLPEESKRIAAEAAANAVRAQAAATARAKVPAGSITPQEFNQWLKQLF